MLNLVHGAPAELCLREALIEQQHLLGYWQVLCYRLLHKLVHIRYVLQCNLFESRTLLVLLLHKVLVKSHYIFVLHLKQ